MRSLLAGLLLVSVATAGFLSWLASTHPDGLEWAVRHTSGREELVQPESNLHSLSANLQEKTALLPDYDSKEDDSESAVGKQARPAGSASKSAAGIIGVAITLLLVCLVGICLSRFNKARYSDR
jgi:cobalt/nickel transport system permease protein